MRIGWRRHHAVGGAGPCGLRATLVHAGQLAAGGYPTRLLDAPLRMRRLRDANPVHDGPRTVPRLATALAGRRAPEERVHRKIVSECAGMAARDVRRTCDDRRVRPRALIRAT